MPHRDAQAVFLTVTDLETRLHNTASNPYSRIESFLYYKYSNMICIYDYSGWAIVVMEHAVHDAIVYIWERMADYRT